MKLWLEYHGLGLALIALGLAALVIAAWVPPISIFGSVLVFIGIFRACDAQAAHRRHLRESEEAFGRMRRKA